MWSDPDDFMMELKRGFFSGFPNLSDVEYAWSLRRIPFFSGETLEGNVRSYAIVSLTMAQYAHEYDKLNQKLNSYEISSSSRGPLLVFQIIKPVIQMLIERDEYVGLAEIITPFFMELDHVGNSSPRRLINSIFDEIDFQLNKSSDEGMRNALKACLQKLSEARKSDE